MNIPNWPYYIGSMVGLVIVLLLWRRCVSEYRRRQERLLAERHLEEVIRQGRG